MIRFSVPAPLRRVLAVLVSLSVQWSTLAGALVACADMGPAVGEASETVSARSPHAEAGPAAIFASDSAAAMEGMSGMIGMPGIVGMRSEDRGDPADRNHRDSSTSPSVPPCCASVAPPLGEGPDAPSGDCVLTATCMAPMMPAHAAALRVARGVAAPLLSRDELAPPALTAPPDAPPPRA